MKQLLQDPAPKDILLDFEGREFESTSKRKVLLPFDMLAYPLQKFGYEPELVQGPRGGGIPGGSPGVLGTGEDLTIQSDDLTTNNGDFSWSNMVIHRQT